MPFYKMCFSTYKIILCCIYRGWAPWDPVRSGWHGLQDSYSRQWIDYHHPKVSSESNSLEDSLSKSSSLSQSSLSSSDKEKWPQSNIRTNRSSENPSGIYFLTDNRAYCNGFSRQTSQISNSTLPSWSGSELPNTSGSASRCTSTGESMFDDVTVSLQDQNLSKNCFKDYQYSEVIGPTRRRSSLSDALSVGPYLSKKVGEDTMKTNKEKRKRRDIIVQEDEEEAYPFAKYTFNKKTEKSKADDSTSTLSSMSTKSSSQESIFSVGLMKQYVTLKNGKMPVMNKQSSSSSMISSMTSSFADQNTSSMSMDDNNLGQDFDSFKNDWRMRNNSKIRYQKSAPNLFLNIPPPMQNPYNYPMFNYPQMPAPEQLLNSYGLDEARSILPERFMKSWIEKAMMTQQEEYMRCMMNVSPQMSTASSYYDNPYYVDDSDLPPSVSAQQSAATTPQYRSSIENIHGMAKLFNQPQPSVPERKVLQRSHTFNSSMQEMMKSRANSFAENEDDDTDKKLASIGALPLKKENSFDKLKRILHSSFPVQYKEKNFRRSMFASSQQKSLPIFLETLTEEDEEKRRSRTPSFEYIPSKKSSNMRSFIEEEKRSCQASSSDTSNNSEISGCSSASSYFDPSDKLVGEEAFTALFSSSFDFKKEHCSKDENSIISIPSIVVSERDNENIVSKDAKNETDLNQPFEGTKTESILPRIVEEACSPTNEKINMSRPASPNPDNQDTHNTVGSKHNLEIAEIMSNKSTELFRKVSKKERSLKTLEHMHADWAAPKSGHFLSISGTDFDDRHLSPASSVASPNIMSPITVIEVNKLDNQNDSLDMDEAKATEHKNARLQSVGTIDSSCKSHSGLQREVLFEGKHELNSQHISIKRKKSKKYKAPKCLTLKRHLNDCDNLSGKNSSSDSENVFEEKKLNLAKTDSKNNEVQADDDSLVPLITVSEVSALLKQLSQSIPQLAKDPLFVLAHDRATQCTILNTTSSYETVNDKETQEQTFPVALNITEIEKDSVDNIDNLVSSYSQTDERYLSFEKEKSKLQNENLVTYGNNEEHCSEQVKFQTVKEIFIENADSSQRNDIVSGLFRSEKVLSLKRMEPEFKVKPSIVNNRKGLSLHTSYLNLSAYIKDEIAGKEESDGHRDTRKCFTIHLSENDVCKSDMKVEVENRVDLKHQKSDNNNQYIVNSGQYLDINDDGDDDENVKYRKTDSFENVNSSPSSELSYESEGILKQDDENSVKTFVEITKENSKNLFAKAQQYSSEHCGMNGLLMLDKTQNHMAGNVINIGRKKIEELHKKDDHDDECIEDDVSDRRLFHTECTFNPVWEDKFNIGKVKGTYTSSISFVLKSDNSERGICDKTKMNTFQNEMSTIESLGNHATEPVAKRDEEIFENESFTENGKGNTQETAVKSVVQILDLKEVHSKYNNGELNPNNQGDTLIEENVMEGRVEKKGRQTNILRKFRALIGNKVDEVDNEPTSTVDDSSTDDKSKIISNRSLDFETIGSRKNILHRCLKTGFAKSFDIGKVEENTEISSAEIQAQDIKAYSFDDRKLHDNVVIRESAIKDEEVVKKENANVDKSINHFENMGANSNDIQKSELADSEFEIKDFYQADECNSVMYQVGFNYNNEQECYDVYGRVKFYRDDMSENVLKDSNGNSLEKDDNILKVDGVFDLAEADVLDMINSEMKDVTSESGIKQLILDMNKKCEESSVKDEVKPDNVTDKNGNHNHNVIHHGNNEGPLVTKMYGKRKVFDMFQQIEDDDVDLLTHGNEQDNSDCKEGLKYEVSTFDGNNGEDDVTRKTLEKIEKLYSLSVYEQTNIPEHFELEMTGDENFYENGNYLDQETELLDSYDIDNEEYELMETHVCRNCGHSVTVETTGIYGQEQEEVIEHAFCCKCSPLKFTSEMLERRRIQRLVQNDHLCN